MFGGIELNSPDLLATISSTNPSGCGTTDGVISIAGIAPNTAFNLTYYNGVIEQLNLISNMDGEIVVIGLSIGVYDSIVLTYNNGCIIEFGAVVLTNGDFEANVVTNNPTSCYIDDGSIIISNLIPNIEFTVNYSNGENQSVTKTTNGNGFLIITGLGSGLYANIILSDNLNQCTSNLGSLELHCGDTFECFEIKKFFTPNGDNHNDYWFLKELSGRCAYKVFIFDRFGKHITTLTPNKSRWDGTYNGRNMPSNDYWYLINYKNNEGIDLKYKSHFTLKR